MLIDGRFGGQIFSGTNHSLQQFGNAAVTVVNGERGDIVYDGVVEGEGGSYSVNSTPVSPEIYWTTLSARGGTWESQRIISMMHPISVSEPFSSTIHFPGQ